MDASTVPRTAPLAGRRPAALLRLAGDERLVAEVRAGSEVAFEVIYDRHHRGILSFCRHMLGSVEEAEDAAQHTYTSAYRAMRGSDNAIQLKAWLYTIARNRCVSMLRARREQPSDEIEPTSLDGLADEVQRREDLRALVRDVASLPDDQRAALVLAEVGDVSHAEIAQVLDVAPQKVKALVFQARTSLMATRDARDTPCEEVQEQLAVLRGGSLRRTTLRRHLRECEGCRDFRAKLNAQRAGLACVLPVVPALGFKEAVLAAAFGAGGGGAGGAGLAAGGGLGALAAKGLVSALAVGGGVAGVAAVSPDAGSSPKAPTAITTPATTPTKDASGPAPESPQAGGAAAAAAARAGDEPRASRRTKERAAGRSKARTQAEPVSTREDAEGDDAPVATQPAEAGDGTPTRTRTRSRTRSATPDRGSPRPKQTPAGTPSRPRRPAPDAPAPKATPAPTRPPPAATPPPAPAPPVPTTDDDDDDDEGKGKGKGHEKGRGKGHAGHDDD